MLSPARSVCLSSTWTRWSKSACVILIMFDVCSNSFILYCFAVMQCFILIAVALFKHTAKECWMFLNISWCHLTLYLISCTLLKVDVAHVQCHFALFDLLISSVLLKSASVQRLCVLVLCNCLNKTLSSLFVQRGGQISLLPFLNSFTYLIGFSWLADSQILHSFTMFLDWLCVHACAKWGMLTLKYLS